ncbi:hypothetical protein ACFPRL_26735 [Pseudoclavibacter helvolus]
MTAARGCWSGHFIDPSSASTSCSTNCFQRSALTGLPLVGRRKESIVKACAPSSSSWSMDAVSTSSMS